MLALESCHLFVVVLVPDMLLEGVPLAALLVAVVGAGLVPLVAVVLDSVILVNVVRLAAPLDTLVDLLPLGLRLDALHC